MIDILKEQIKEIEDKEVANRENHEHRFLIEKKHKGSVRDYLLSMGDFKEEKNIERCIEAVDDIEEMILKKEKVYGYRFKGLKESGAITALEFVKKHIRDAE